MTRSSTKELFSPLENPEQKFRSRRRLFDTPSLIESNSPEFDQISDIEEQSEEKEVILFYNGLDVPTRQILDSQGAIPSKTVADAKVAIQEMAEFSQKWHNGTSLRSRRGDLNGYIEAAADRYARVHGGFGYGARNEEGRTILEFATAHDLVVVNSVFKKSDAYLITFQSGGHNTQIDYLLVHKGDLRACKDCRAFPSKACSSQHRLVTLDVLFERQRQRRARTERPRILWKNLNRDAIEAFRATVLEKLSTLGEDLSASDAD
nr:glyoxalase I, glyoxalase/bleomycin resistance protein/dihydroxybiphenyl dioxygenase [Tanacetum cinerariifolium]